ncbi:hypothetical protein BLNAU_7661 [Blattamonas nauphoetae]|uniref:Uncharacterized protein n=1 Tax=Blattamonas nauphoetae TaxID=2049346 RepID=A0ABQ9Y0L7_9EUKA|nr:hypothetical protein BLNAU_7661 [Blattamonas nauphoetae]
MVFPPLLFTAPSHFIVRSSIVTRTAGAITLKRSTNTSLILIGDPVTTGIVSVTMTILSLPATDSYTGEIFISLLDTTTPDTEVDEIIGCNIKNSVALSSSTGRINSNTPSTRRVTGLPLNYSHLKEGACVRMEVDMESTPPTVQFFMNGKAGRFDRSCSGSAMCVHSLLISVTEMTWMVRDRIVRMTQKEWNTTHVDEVSIMDCCSDVWEGHLGAHTGQQY